MSRRSLTKVPKRSLVYFSIDKSTSIVDTKKLRMKDSGLPFTESGPHKKAEVTLKLGGKTLDAIVIASDDNKDKLNTEEQEFVDNPENAELFHVDPPSCKKRCQQDKNLNPPKRTKTSDDEVQMLNAPLAEQTEKQARLKQLRVEKAMIQTREVAVQVEPIATADTAVQTDFPDIMEDLTKQVASLNKVVAELTKLHTQQTLRPNPSPFSDAETLCDSLISGFIDQGPPPVVPPLIAPDPTSVPASDTYPPTENQPLLVPGLTAIPASDTFPPVVNQPLLAPAPPVNQAVPASGQNLFVPLLSSASPHPQLRSPLSTLDSNAQVAFSSVSIGPTDEQKRKVEVKINTRCRGKRRTVLRRLQKQTDFS